jgi:hypothetical protein
MVPRLFMSKDRTFHRRAVRIGARELCACQIGPTEGHSGEICLSQIHPQESNAGKVCKRKISV